MSYTPKTGGGPAKLIDYLRTKEPGYQVTNSTAAAIMLLPISSITNTLMSAITAGMLLREFRDGKPLYALSESIRTAPPADAAAGAFAQLADALESGADLGRADPAAPAAEPFHAMLHIDGDLDLHGLVELADGGFRVLAADVNRLARMLGVR